MKSIHIKHFVQIGRSCYFAITVLLMVAANNIAFLHQVYAVTEMTHSSVILYNMNASSSGAFAIAFTASAADSASSLTINFGSWGGTVNTVQSVSTTGCTAMTGASTVLPSSSSLAASGSGNIVTITNVNPLVSGTSYCAVLTSPTALTNPSAGVYTVTTTDGSDSSTPAIDIIPNDQVVVSAIVPPSFTLALSGNTDSFVANLSATSDISTSGVTATINTNAASGWMLWAEDSQAGLRSVSAGHTIASVATGASTNLASGHGSEQYALGVTSVTAGTIAANYNDSGHTGSGLSASTYYQIASNTVPSSSDNVIVKELANIATTTPASANYTDTVTLIGAGSF
jgi:hypothetical protein